MYIQRKIEINKKNTAVKALVMRKLEPHLIRTSLIRVRQAQTPRFKIVT